MKLTMRIRLLNEYVKLVRLSWHDMIRYAKHACIGWNRGDYDEGQLEGRMIANYHVVEKGLSMPDFRPRFGAPTVKKLISLIQEGEQKFKWCQNVNYLTAVQVVRAYMNKHQALGIDLTDLYTPDEISFGENTTCDQSLVAGPMEHHRNTYFTHAQTAFDEFAKSRHSCRVFDLNQEVDLAKIKSAIDTARYTPSVCNRQCWRVHIYQDKSKVDALLALQDGNRGFGHTIPTILVITSSLKVFDGFKERNQGYMDGGLFSMSLMYALHHQELGCVPMCWLASNERDNAFRKEAGIQDEEVVMMLLGVGVPVDNFSAPASQRRLVEEFTVLH